MRKNITLSLPISCHEKWDAFTPEHNGRHCGVCCKTVIDFTGWSDEKIIHYIGEHSQEKICGRFQPTQLRTYVLPSVHVNPLRRFVAGAIALFLSIGAAQTLRAQCTSTKMETVSQVQASRTMTPPLAVAGILQGHVSDDSGASLPGASVMIEGTTTGTVTDAEGNFQLTIPESVYERYVIDIMFIGFTTNVVEIKRDQRFIEVTMTSDMQVLQGELLVFQKPGPIKRVGYFFKRLRRKLDFD